MFLFPWFDYGIDTLKFEKSHFLAARVILGDFSPPKWQFCAVRTMSKSCVNLDVMNFFINFQKFFRKISKLSGDIFMTSGDHLVAQKDDFTKKKSKKSLSQGPPWLHFGVIYHAVS